MTALPEVPRYLVPISAMSVWRDGGMLTDQIGMVTYADHLTAMQAAQTINSSVIAAFQRQARDTALREALRTVKDCRTGFRMSIGASPEPPERYWLPKDDALAAIQRLIDEGGTR